MTDDSPCCPLYRRSQYAHAPQLFTRPGLKNTVSLNTYLCILLCSVNFFFFCSSYVTLRYFYHISPFHHWYERLGLALYTDLLPSVSLPAPFSFPLYHHFSLLFIMTSSPPSVSLLSPLPSLSIYPFLFSSY